MGNLLKREESEILNDQLELLDEIAAFKDHGIRIPDNVNNILKDEDFIDFNMLKKTTIFLRQELDEKFDAVRFSKRMKDQSRATREDLRDFGNKIAGFHNAAASVTLNAPSKETIVALNESLNNINEDIKRDERFKIFMGVLKGVTKILSNRLKENEWSDVGDGGGGDGNGGIYPNIDV